ncbi:uncharacterized protein METZ01_LOCUS165956, partial [marine metagenome]
MYEASIDNETACWFACTSCILIFSTSTISCSSLKRTLSDNAAFKTIPASIGLMSSFPNNAANL